VIYNSYKKRNHRYYKSKIKAIYILSFILIGRLFSLVPWRRGVGRGCSRGEKGGREGDNKYNRR